MIPLIALIMVIPIFVALPQVQAATTLNNHWIYSIDGGANYLWCRGAMVELWKSSTSGGSYTHVQGQDGMLDDNGWITFSVTGGYYYKVKIRLCDNENFMFKHPDDTYGYYWWGSPKYVPSGTTKWQNDTISNDQALWKCYDNLRAAHSWLWHTTAWDCPFCTVYYPDPCWFGPDMPHTMFANGDIHVPTSCYYLLSNATVMQHEYGHHIQFCAQGSFDAISGTHSISTETTCPKAFGEGWADFLPSAINNNPNMGFGNIERSFNNTDLTPTTWDSWANYPEFLNHQDYSTYNWDGYHVEGSVAEVLWDLFDGISASDSRPGWHIPSGDRGDNIQDMFTRTNATWHIFLVDHVNTLEGLYNKLLYYGFESVALNDVFVHARCWYWSR